MAVRIVQYVNTVLYPKTLAIERSEGLPHLKPMEEDRSSTDNDPEAL
jgi:hypothetical protein